MHKSILYLVESKNPPVFKTPMIIVHDKMPEVAKSFFFDKGRLSMVKYIKSQDGYKIITTLNSKYYLYPLSEVTK